MYEPPLSLLAIQALAASSDDDEEVELEVLAEAVEVELEVLAEAVEVEAEVLELVVLAL